MPSDRYDREIDVREPAILRTAPAKVVVGGLWAIKDKRRGVVTGYSTSEIHARAVAAHAQVFEVEFVTGPFELPDGTVSDTEVVPEGRFRRILENESG